MLSAAPSSNNALPIVDPDAHATPTPRFRSRRRLLMLMGHVVLFMASNTAAFLLRFDGQIPTDYAYVMLQTLPLLIVTRSLVFFACGLFDDVWRHTSVWDALNIVRASNISSGAFFVAVVLLPIHPAYPRSVIVIDLLLLLILSCAVRLTRRMLLSPRASGRRRVLIFGAGDAGEVVARELKKNPHHPYRPVGFVDDNPYKTGSRIHGIPVLGGRGALPDIIRTSTPDEILVAIPRATPAIIRGIVSTLEPFRLPIKTLPALEDIAAGRAGVGEIRTLSIEDLLTRQPVSFELDRLRNLVRNRRVLVTGAAGSIGSELSRQLTRLMPAHLTLFERHEAGLWEIDHELCQGRPEEVRIDSVVGDVTDRLHVQRLFERYRPDLVFHAAAHKHVPLMEAHPCEAAKNNVLGTFTVATAALQAGVERLVFISTDKAVNPSSIMGATKRIAELTVQALARPTKRDFLCVRFGNVLGSSGSVIPLFLKQIKRGGPVTVTHPDVTRYFMLTSEAVHLVLHSAALGGAGALYVLEMGEQVRIVEMARNLIRLAGHVPDQDIRIHFTGLRPGEKLYEELTSGEEHLEPSGVSKVLRVVGDGTCATVLDRIPKFAGLIEAGDNKGLLALLDEILPEFRAARAGSSGPLAA